MNRLARVAIVSLGLPLAVAALWLLARQVRSPAELYEGGRVSGTLVSAVVDAFPDSAPYLAGRAHFVPAEISLGAREIVGFSLEREPPVPPPSAHPLETRAWLERALRDSDQRFTPFFPRRYRDPFRVEANGVSASVRAKGARSAEAEIEDGKIVYRDAYRDTDIIYTAGERGSEEFMLLRSPDAPLRFRYEMNVEGAARVFVDGGTVRLLNESGTGLTIARPWLIDALGRRSHTALRWELSGTERLTLTLDPEGLSYPLLVDPSWVPTGDLNLPTTGHTATLLNDGKVLVVGGFDGTSYTNAAEIYDPATGLWGYPPNFPSVGRTEHTATLLPDGRAVVAGGFDGFSYNGSADVYDPSSGTWSLATLNLPRGSHTATLLPDGNVLLVGGFNGFSYLGNWEVLDTTTLLTSATGLTFYGNRARHTATTLDDGRVLLTGGEDGFAPLGTTELFDPGSLTSSPALGSGMVAPRSSHTASKLDDGTVLVAGGLSGGTTLADAEVFDPASESWSPTSPLTEARAGHTATSFADGRVMVAAGASGGAYLASTEVYDPASGAWSTGVGLGTGRTDHTATLLTDGRVLVAGGDDGQLLALRSSELRIDTGGPGAWWSTGGLGSARYAHTATLLQSGRVLVVGGGPGDQSTAELYEPSTGLWAATGALIEGRSRHTASLLHDGRVLVTGGTALGSTFASCELYDPATGSWSTTGSLGVEREFHTATLLASGEVLIAGGRDGAGNPLPGAELYDPSTGSWSAAAGLNVARHGHATALLADGNVLVSGGMGLVALGSSEVYDPVADTWSLSGALLVARTGHSMTLLPDGRALAVGGSGAGAAQSWELYDPTSGLWSSTASTLNAPREGHTASLLPNGHVLVAGGTAAGNAVEVFDPSSTSWAVVPDVTDARSGHSATVLPGGDVLVTGGIGGGPLQSSELFRSASGSWSPAQDMGTPRALHTSTLLPDGRILVAGGWDSADLATCEIYDPAADTWSPTGSMNYARRGHEAVLLMDGSVLVVGGSTAGTATEVYDRVTGTWRDVGSLNEARFAHSVTLLSNGKVLVAGGTIRSSAELYDPLSETWTFTGSLPGVRGFHSATLLPNGMVLIAGGSNSSAFLGTALLYDPDTGVWTATGSMNDTRRSHAATLLPNGKVFVIGGSGNFQSLTKSEIYDPASGTWTQGAPMNSPRSTYHEAVLLSDGRVLLAAGTDANEGMTDVEIYDPATGTWVYTDFLVEPRSLFGATLLPNGKVLVSGSQFWTGTQWISLDTAEIFDPGLGFDDAWRPTLTSVPDPIVEGAGFSAVGTKFQGVSEASGGNGHQASSTNHPLLQIRRLDNEASRFAPLDQALGWSDTSFAVAPIQGIPAGPAYATIFTNGIPSVSKIVNVECAAPSITIPPASQVTCMGGMVAFTVAAAGECVSYRWRRDGVDLADGGHYSGTATDTLTVSNVDWADEGAYDVVLSSTCSSATLTSSPVTLTLDQPFPTFAGLASVSAQTTPACHLKLDWMAGASGCPTTPGIVYNVYRSTTPGFTPGPANLHASCVTDLFYDDAAGLVDGTTYYYKVRAEDASTGFGGPCNGGREDVNVVELSDTTTCSTTATPLPVPFFTVTSKHQENRLEWVNPPVGTSVTFRYDTTGHPASVTDGTALAVAAGTPGGKQLHVHSSLANDTTYFYSAFADNGSGFPVRTTAKGRPFDTSGPAKWAYNTGATAMTAPGIGPSVHAVSNDRVVHAMVRGDLSGGNWPASWFPMATNGPVQGRPPVVPTSSVAGSSQVLFLGSQDGYVYAVDAIDGAQLWRSSPRLGDMVQSAPSGIFADFGGTPFDHILVGTRNASSDNAVFALRASDGTEEWRFTNGGGVDGIGIISGDAVVDYATRRLYFGSRAKAGGSPNTLWALELTGSGFNLLWARDSIGDVDGGPSLLNGRLYVGTNTSRVYAFDADTGADLWSAPFDLADGPVKGFVWTDRFSTSLYVATTGTVWSLSDDGASVSMDWQMPVLSPSIPLFTPAGSHVLVGSGDGSLHQIDVSTQSSTSVTLGDGSAAIGSPSFDIFTNLVYVGSTDGVIYAVQIPF